MTGELANSRAARGLNRNQLKYLVIIAMFIDHIAWAFVPMDTVLGQVMHFIGRLTGPTMAYFIAEGYQHTRNVKKYIGRLGIFALLSWIPFVFFEFGCLPFMIMEGNSAAPGVALQFYFTAEDITIAVYPWFGVLYTLLLSLFAIWLWDKSKCPKWCKVLGIVGLCLISVFGDWAVFDILYALFFFCYREQTKKKWIVFSIVTIFHIVVTFLFGGIFWKGLYQLGIFMVPLLIQFCYNGEGGSRKPIHKWFFYIFYPAHLVLLGLLKLLWL